MAARPSRFRLILSIVIGAMIVIVALPTSAKQSWAPSWLKPEFHLGLDLAGGTQLDFRISEAEIDAQLANIDTELNKLQAEGGSVERVNQLQLEKTVLQEQRLNLVEAIRTVLERRINSLGVSEATITPSYVGNEKHLLVECPGVVDVQQCIDTVGKTIQLEFKEEFTEATQEFENEVRAKATAALRRITQSGTSLAVVGEDMGAELGMGYEHDRLYFRDQLPKGMEAIWNRRPQDGVARYEGSINVQAPDENGTVTQQTIPGVFLAEVVMARTMTGRTIMETKEAFGIITKSGPGITQQEKIDTELDAPLSGRMIAGVRAMKQGDLKVVPLEDGTSQLIFLRQFIAGRELVDASHILVAYKGATTAAATITRTKEEALARAQDLKNQLDAGATFEDLARAQSDGPSKANAGKLQPVGHGDLTPSFEAVAFAQTPGIISDPVETPFGYHLIRVDKAPYTTPDKATYDALVFAGSGSEALANQKLDDMQQGRITRQEEAVRIRVLFFSLKPTGWKDTALDGKHFRSASVSLDPTTNIPVVQIVFDEEGGKIFQELTRTNVGKRIAIFVGGELVSAPTVQGEIIGGTAVITGSNNVQEAQLLAQDLNTGAIPAPIYLSGQRTVEATLGAKALETSALAGIIGMLIVMLYMFIVYRMLGLIANLALIIYAIIFLALLKLPLFLFTDQYVVLTLAGAAGLILSIGMAVDTNVLVFERIKEELRKGKMLKTAVEIGFEKAWSSIRDSNISTIITCVLLFMIGTSIVRGFAVTLGLGVVVSMFTGMIITRWICRKLADSSLATKHTMYPGMKPTSES